MRRLPIFVTFLVLLLVSPWAMAVRVNSIFEAEIAVASQSEQERVNAIPQGLDQVLIKTSGNAQISKTTNFGLDQSHMNALVQEWSYTPQSSKSKPYILTLHFDPDGITRLLRDAGSPAWGPIRPLILVWMTYEGPTHTVDIVDSSTDTLQNLLKATAKERGLPVILPVMDVTDLAQVSMSDITSKSIVNLQKASIRYNNDAILIGHVTQIGSDVVSDWLLVMGADQWNWEIKGKSLQEVLSGIVNNVTDTLASRYASVVTDSVQTELTVKVANIKQQTDLLQLMKYLQHLTPVSEVELVSVVGTDITLNVSLRSNKQAFTQAVGLNKTLKPVTSKIEQPEDTLLYQWAR